VECRLVEQAMSRRTAPKAINLHTRTLEIFDVLGIADEAVTLGSRVGRLNSYSVAGRVRPITRIDLTGLDSRFPFTLTLPQPETERLIEQLAAKHGVLVEWGTRCTGVTRDGDAVIARLEHGPGGEAEDVRAAWLVGCDGIDSTVRESVGVPFSRMRYPDDVLCADVRLDWDRPHDEAHVFLSRRGTLRCMPMPGSQRWRLVADLAPHTAGRIPSQPDLEHLQALVDARGISAGLHDLTWCSRFNIYRCSAADYRVGRVMLAGDAAHVHSPLGAQGMNLGLQDAYNLAWKLSLVLSGRCEPGLLDSYAEERRAIARGVLRRTDRNTRLIGARGAVARAARNMAGRLFLGLPAAQKRLGRTGAMLTMNYRSSRRWFRRGPVPGDRAPDTEFGPVGHRIRCHDLLRGTGHVLLLFGGAGGSRVRRALLDLVAQVGPRWGDNVRPYLVLTGPPAPAQGEPAASVLYDPDGDLHRSWHARAGHVYLVRPDGYVGYRAKAPDVAGISRHLGSLFGSG
jgi:2-polyprenyl-6-methoxyphenol hydroxylase-like FAD-dependent oxidoreductase